MSNSAKEKRVSAEEIRKRRRDEIIKDMSEARGLKEKMLVKNIESLHPKSVEKVLSGLSIGHTIAIYASKRFGFIDRALQLESLHSKENKKVEFFHTSEILFNVRQHKHIPHHSKADISPDQLPIDKLPSILLSDPVIRYIGLKEGDICKIVQRGSSETTYRKVVTMRSTHSGEYSL